MEAPEVVVGVDEEIVEPVEQDSSCHGVGESLHHGVDGVGGHVQNST
jgi:hypothetical protein